MSDENSLSPPLSRAPIRYSSRQFAANSGTSLFLATCMAEEIRTEKIPR